MTLIQLEHVRHAHRSGSFSGAARACGVTQAALSNSIAKLEEELGERIFSRTTKSVRLSPFGETLIAHIDQILSGRDALLGAARERSVPTMTVIGHSPLFPSTVLAKIVGSIRDAGFGAEIRLVEENLADLLQRLGEHTLDIALIPDADYGPSFRSTPVWREPLYFVPRRSRAPLKAPVALASVASDTFVMVPDRCGLARATLGLFDEAGLSMHAYAGEAMGYHVLQEWAALDLGSAILPQSRMTDGTGAVPLLLSTGEPARLTYCVVWHKQYERGKQLATLLRPHRAT